MTHSGVQLQYILPIGSFIVIWAQFIEFFKFFLKHFLLIGGQFAFCDIFDEKVISYKYRLNISQNERY